HAPAQKGSHESDRHGQPKRASVPAKCLWEGIEKPVKRREAVRFLSRLVNFAISPRHQRLEIATCLGLGGEGRYLRQVGRGPLIEIMKMLHLLESELECWIAREFVQERFQLAPMRPLTGEEFPKVDDHGNPRGDEVSECWTAEGSPVL